MFYDSRRTQPASLHHTGQHDPVGPDSGSEEWTTESEDEETAGKGSVDYKVPMTWPYSWIFELYLFAVKHEARRFRLDVQDIVHMKLQEQVVFPEPATVAMVVGGLSGEDTLYQLLAHWYSWMDVSRSGETRVALAERLSVIPSGFGWLVSVMKGYTVAARNCAICGQGNTDEKCNAEDHSAADALNPLRMAACFYHDHRGDREELSRCYWRWLSTVTRIRTIECYERVEFENEIGSFVSFVHC